MKKETLKAKIDKLSLSLIEHTTRAKTFLVITSMVFSLIVLGCTIINFANHEIELGTISSSYLVAFVILIIVEVFVFLNNPKAKTTAFEFITAILLISLSLLYIFFAPSYTVYLFWINIAPIFLCLFFGMQKD